MDWSATQYLRFEEERTRPARNLCDAIPNTRARYVSDLGCGPGNSTDLLLARYPDAEIVGVDASPAMIEKARKRLPQMHFVQADISEWTPDTPQDVIYANASLQWLPDHAATMLRLVGHLETGGSLAVQMPDNVMEPSHVSMREVAMDGPWAQRLAPVIARRQKLGSAADFYSMLRPSCSRVDVWHTIYNHPVADGGAIVEWFKGSALQPYLAPLDDAERAEFLAIYRERIDLAYPTLSDGMKLLAVPRLFVVATR